MRGNNSLSCPVPGLAGFYPAHGMSNDKDLGNPCHVTISGKKRKTI